MGAKHTAAAVARQGMAAAAAYRRLTRKHSRPSGMTPPHIRWMPTAAAAALFMASFFVLQPACKLLIHHGCRTVMSSRLRYKVLHPAVPTTTSSGGAGELLRAVPRFFALFSTGFPDL